MIAKNLSGKLLKFQKSKPHMFFQMFYFSVFGVLCQFLMFGLLKDCILMLQTELGATIEPLGLIHFYIIYFFTFFRTVTN